MEWLMGIAGGLMLGGLTVGGVLQNIWVIVIAISAGIIIAIAGSWYQQAEEATTERKRLSQYPSYKY